MRFIMRDIDIEALADVLFRNCVGNERHEKMNTR
jgi:hypothetical protein